MVMMLTSYLSSLSTRIGQIAVNGLRRYGVNTEFIARGGDHVGLYYCRDWCFYAPIQGNLRPCTQRNC